MSLLYLNIVDAPFITAMALLSLAGGIALMTRGRGRRMTATGWLLWMGGSIIVGAIAGLITVGVVVATGAAGIPIGWTVTAWVCVTFAGVALAIANFRSARRRRMLLAGVCIPLFLLTGAAGVNSAFGLNRTLAAVLGMPTQPPLSLPRIPPKSATPSAIPGDQPLWKTWTPPADLPLEGTIGAVEIPSPKSGFASRPAGLYLPPAALVADPPKLPLVIMMMGQPGNPDPAFQKAILDDFAARHGGLAPIVLVADQLGDPNVDSVCADSPTLGNARSFIVDDVVEWAQSHLHVLSDRTHWTIAGYSAGGVCALSLGAAYPNIWANVLDISGEEYPGSDNPDQAVRDGFGGDEQAFEAAKPSNILTAGTYPDTTAIFTVGSDDTLYRDQAIRAADAARAAGWNVTYFEVLNGGHVLGALNGGLAEGYRVLFPRLGLSAQGVEP